MRLSVIFMVVALGVSLTGCDRSETSQATAVAPKVSEADSDYNRGRWMGRRLPIVPEDPAVATLTGETLAVFFRGKKIYSAETGTCPLATSTDHDSCQVHYIKSLKLLSPETGQIESYAQLEFNYGNYGDDFLPLGQGALFYIDGEAFASPDGKTLVAGSLDPLNRQLTIYDWTGHAPPMRFEDGCVVNAWQDDHRFTVLCDHVDPSHQNTGSHAYEGRVEQDASGHWSLQQTRLLDYDGIAYQHYTPKPPEKQTLRVLLPVPLSATRIVQATGDTVPA